MAFEDWDQQAKHGTIVIARVGEGNPEVLGVVNELDLGGKSVPTFYVTQGERKIPIVFMDQGDPTSVFKFEATGETLEQFFAKDGGYRQVLAKFYVQLCAQKLNETADDYAVLNAVYWLEKQGVTIIDDSNMQAAANICMAVRRTLKDFVDMLIRLQTEVQVQ